MKSFAVAKRYAAALWMVAPSGEVAEAWLRFLESFWSLYQEQREVELTLSSPLFSWDDKKSILEVILQKQNAPKEVSAFLMKVLEAGRMPALGDIVQVFRARVFSAQGVIELHVDSALPLTDAQRQDLKMRFEKMTSKRITLVENVHADLLAGMKVSYAGRTLDGSLRTHLANLEKHLLKEDIATHATA